MSLIDFVGLAGFVLAVSAGLDFASSDGLKRRLAARMVAITTKTSSGFHGWDFANRFFGPRLFSGRAVSRYAALSVISLALTYGFAYATTPVYGPAGDVVSIFHRSVTGLDVIIVALCVLSAVLADIVSYAQTRIFLGAVDRFKSPVVSLGLIVADGLISVGLFALSFSIARFVSLALVVSSTPTPNLVVKSYYNPAAVVDFLASTNAPSQLGEYERLLKALEAFSRNGIEPLLQAQLRQFNPHGPGENRHHGRFEYQVSRVCFSQNKLEALAQMGPDTTLLLQRILLERYHDPKAAAAAANRLIQILSNRRASSNKGCGVPGVEVRQTISRKDLLYVAGARDAYLAALERTAYDTYVVAAYKFSPYVSFDPYNSQSEYFAVLNEMVRQTFLGMFIPDPEKVAVFDAASPQASAKGQVRVLVPFSPMLASCLSITILFAVYLVYVIIIGLRNQVSRAMKVGLPQIDLDKALFTSVALVVVGIWTIAYVTFSVLEVAWSVLVG